MSLFYLILFIIFIFLILKTIKTELPKRLEKERMQWEQEKRKEEIIKKHEDKQNLEIQKTVKEERKKVFEDNRRKRAREHYLNIDKRGKEYELYIAEHFRKQGYKVKEHGLINNRADSGIDVIAMKNKEITLIQCKNWRENSKYKVDHNLLKAFIGNTTDFLEKNKEKANGYIIKRLFVTSSDVLDNSARYFLKESNLIEHQIISIEE